MNKNEFPYNLLIDMTNNEDLAYIISKKNPDLEGLEFVMSLAKQSYNTEYNILIGHYRNGKTLRDLSYLLDISEERVDKLRAHILQELNKEPYRSLLMNKVCNYGQLEISLRDYVNKDIEKFYSLSIYNLVPYVKTRTYNNICRTLGSITIGELIVASNKKLVQKNNIGDKIVADLRQGINKLGQVCNVNIKYLVSENIENVDEKPTLTALELRSRMRKYPLSLLQKIAPNEEEAKALNQKPDSLTGLEYVIDKLNEKDNNVREVLHGYFGGLSSKELSAKLGIGIRLVESTKNNALNNLKKPINYMYIEHGYNKIQEQRNNSIQEVNGDIEKFKALSSTFLKFYLSIATYNCIHRTFGVDTTIEELVSVNDEWLLSKIPNFGPKRLKEFKEAMDNLKKDYKISI